MSAPLVFLDTETTGLNLDDDIWEFAGIRRASDGAETALHLFIDHDLRKCVQLPESFKAGHLARFPGHNQFDSKSTAASKIGEFLWPEDDKGKVHVIGAVPNFDTEHLARLMRETGHQPRWHYHLIDVENLAVGYLMGRRIYPEDAHSWSPPWESDELSRAVGVEPPGEGERHTAMGDARWAMRIYDAIMGDAS
jgi:hypothetical protein